MKHKQGRPKLTINEQLFIDILNIKDYDKFNILDLPNS